MSKRRRTHKSDPPRSDGTNAGPSAPTPETPATTSSEETKRSKTQSDAPKRSKDTADHTVVPRSTFWRGAAVGLALGLPIVAVTVYLAARASSDAAPRLGHVLRLAAVFAGLPLVLTAGGIARVAARRPTFVAALRASARSSAVVGMAHVILTAVPLGVLPARPVLWIWWAIAGAAQGASVGVVIGVWAAWGKREARSSGSARGGSPAKRRNTTAEPESSSPPAP